MAPGAERNIRSIITTWMSLSSRTVPRNASEGSDTVAGDDPAARAKEAPFPFDSSHSDIILRTIDGVDFRVRKAILAEASPVIECLADQAMQASTPSLEKPSTDMPSPGEPPVIPLAEKSAVVDLVLRLCYPVSARSHRNPSMSDASALLGVAGKYEMDGVAAYITQMLRDSVETSPLRVYCIAVHHGLGADLIRLAARSCLNEPLGRDIHHKVPELDNISASAYSRLLDYHHACSDAAQRVVLQYHLADASFGQRCWATCVTSARKKPACARFVSIESGTRGTQRVMLWFAGFMAQCLVLLKERPSGKQITALETITKALAGAWNCAHCSPRAWGDIHAFLPLLMAGIDTAIAEVSLEIP